jgi:hypothetical protein
MIYKMQWNEHFALAFSIIVLIVAINALKKDHSDLIYGLWYLYFLSFALLLVVEFGIHYASDFFNGDLAKTTKSISEAIVNSVGDLDVAQVPSAGDHLRLMAVVAQARDLP